LTLAAIEKETFAGTHGNGEKAPDSGLCRGLKDQQGFNVSADVILTQVAD
jgi:hypothetical protein